MSIADPRPEAADALIARLLGEGRDEVREDAAEMIRTLMATQAAQRASEARQEIETDLSRRMVAAGMVPLDAITKPNILSAFARHAGVRTPEHLLEWAEKKFLEYERPNAATRAGVREPEPDLDDFILGKASAFSEVVENARFVLGPKS